MIFQSVFYENFGCIPRHIHKNSVPYQYVDRHVVYSYLCKYQFTAWPSIFDWSESLLWTQMSSGVCSYTAIIDIDGEICSQD